MVSAINYMLFWGMFGIVVELIFTAAKSLLTKPVWSKKEWSLIGHVSLWMFPVYAVGLSYGFDFIYWLIEIDLIRWLTYPLWIWLVEIAIGIPTNKRGIYIWSYKYLPYWAHWRGIVSYVHYPLWVLFGVLVELVKY